MEFELWFLAFSDSENSALFWIGWLILASTFVPVLYLHWILNLLSKVRAQKYVLVPSYIISFLFAFLSLTPNYIDGVDENYFFVLAKRDFFVFTLYLNSVYRNLWICIPSSGQRVFLLRSFKKVQIRYVLIGSVISVIGAFTNFPLWFDINILPYGNFLIAIYTFVFAYSMVRYRLMDVRLVFRQLFAYLSQILVIIIAYLFVNWILIHPISSLLDVDQSILLAFGVWRLCCYFNRFGDILMTSRTRSFSGKPSITANFNSGWDRKCRTY